MHCVPVVTVGCASVTVSALCVQRWGWCFTVVGVGVAGHLSFGACAVLCVTTLLLGVLYFCVVVGVHRVSA